MSASTAVLTDLQTCITTGPNATSTANASDATKKIMDLKGNLDLALTKAKELKALLTEIDVDIDSGDTIQTQITAVLAVLV